jgi:hypothetical protein
MKTKIFTVAEVPTTLAHAWLQHLRDFDAAHADCHFEIFADSPDATLQEIVEIVKVHPKLSFQEIFKRQGWK